MQQPAIHLASSLWRYCLLPGQFSITHAGAGMPRATARSTMAGNWEAPSRRL
jgi:hypothetical protein